MTNLKRGDYIQHRGSYAIWHVLAINSDGSLQVEFYAGKRNSPRRLKLIKRPEDYRNVIIKEAIAELEGLLKNDNQTRIKKASTCRYQSSK